MKYVLQVIDTKVEIVFLKPVNSKLGALHRRFIICMLPSLVHRAVMNPLEV